MINIHKAKQGEQQLILDARLPDFIKAPCSLEVHYELIPNEDFYLLLLNVEGDLVLQCQRCMEDFSFRYQNQLSLAVCQDEEQAQQLLTQYEPIVSSNGEIDLEALVVDELHLYAPQVHPERRDCNEQVNRLIHVNN